MFPGDRAVAKDDHVFVFAAEELPFAVRLKEELAGQPLIPLDPAERPGGDAVSIARFEISLEGPRSEEYSELLVFRPRFRGLTRLGLNQHRARNNQNTHKASALAKSDPPVLSKNDPAISGAYVGWPVTPYFSQK